MKKEKDIELVGLMIRMYCKGKHKTKDGLCPECEELAAYVAERRAKCPFGDEKHFCSNCKIHCYKPSMRAKITEVMRYSGPRLIFVRPAAAFRHLADTIAVRRAAKKEAAKRGKGTGKEGSDA